MLLDIRRMAEDALRGDDAIFVVGYSFNEADEYILRMIARAVQDDCDKLLAVLDVEAQPHERLGSFLETHVHSFNVAENRFYRR